jgi:hypothetical protein
MRETGAPLCAISPKDPLIEPSPPSPPKAGGNGFFGKKTKANGEPGLPDHRNPSIDDALAAYEKLDGSNGIGRTDRIHFIAEIQFAKRKGMKDPIAWAIRTTKEGKFFSSPFDHEKAKEYLQELRGSH